MAKISTAYSLGPAWVKVGNYGDTVFVEPQDGGQILLSFKAAAPTAGSMVGHVLNPHQFRAYLSLAENVWARAVDSGRLVVTSDGLGSGTAPGGVTTLHTLSSTWVQAAATSNTFIDLEHVAGAPVLWRANAAAPSAGSIDGHLLRPTDRFHDATNNSNIWVRSASARLDNTASLIVSKG